MYERPLNSRNGCTCPHKPVCQPIPRGADEQKKSARSEPVFSGILIELCTVRPFGA